MNRGYEKNNNFSCNGKKYKFNPLDKNDLREKSEILKKAREGNKKPVIFCEGKGKNNEPCKAVLFIYKRDKIYRLKTSHIDSHVIGCDDYDKPSKPTKSVYEEHHTDKEFNDAINNYFEKQLSNKNVDDYSVSSGTNKKGKKLLKMIS